MAQEKVQEKAPTPARKSSNKTCWIVGGVCGCLTIIIVIFLLVFGSFAGFGLGNLFDNVFKEQKYQDEEDREMSKAELLDYFIEEVTTYSDASRQMRAAKWEKPMVTVSIEDTPPEGGEKAVDDFITKFNNNSTKVKLKRQANGDDIKIYFQESTRDAAGLSGPSTGGDYTIDHADVKLAQNVALFEQSLNSVLSHEIFHALGFTGHYSGSVCRLMSPKTCGSRMTINEERLIQMLYGTDIPVGSNETQIRTFFQNWNPK